MKIIGSALGGKLVILSAKECEILTGKLATELKDNEDVSLSRVQSLSDLAGASKDNFTEIKASMEKIITAIDAVSLGSVQPK